jgi:osmotically inducible protein OsmC
MKSLAVLAPNPAVMGPYSGGQAELLRVSKQGEGFVIDRIALTLQATVPGIDEAKFQEIAAAAKRDCPLSKALASVPEITLQATLR